MSSIPNRYDRWLQREAERKLVDDEFIELDRQADYLADSTYFGPALRFYIEGIIGHPLHWRMVP